MLYGLDMLKVVKNRVVDGRTLGYFTKQKLTTLDNIVKNNVTDVWETIYNYAIVYTVPENTLYYTFYRSIYKAYKVVLPEDLKNHINDVKYEEISLDTLPEAIRKCYVDIDVEEVLEQE